MVTVKRAIIALPLIPLILIGYVIGFVYENVSVGVYAGQKAIYSLSTILSELKKDS